MPNITGNPRRRDVIAHPVTGVRDMTRFQPGWTNFFQALENKRAEAAEQGKRFNVDPIRLRGSAPERSSLRGGSPDQAAINDFNEDAAFAPMRRRAAELTLANAVDQRSSDALAALNTPDRDLFSGQAAARARKEGDILRSEGIRDAEASGQADVANYWAPGAREVRQQKYWDKERDLAMAYPFSKAATDANRAVDVASITGQSRVDAANATAAGRTGSAAMSALARAGTAPIFPGGEDRAGQTMSAILPNVPGQPGAAMSGKVFPAARLAQFAQENGFATPEAARQALEQIYGYRVQ